MSAMLDLKSAVADATATVTEFPSFRPVKGDGKDETNAAYAAFCRKHASAINGISEALKVAGLGDIQILAADLADKHGQDICVFRTRKVQMTLKGGRSSF